MQDIAIVEADLGDPQHQDAIVHLVDTYARDSMGGGKALPEEVRASITASATFGHSECHRSPRTPLASGAEVLWPRP